MSLREHLRERGVGLLVALAHYYLAAVVVWAALHWVFGDRWWWLFLLNSFAEYLFFLLPLPLLVAVITRRRDIAIGFAVVLILGVWLYGGLFLPPLPSGQASGPRITVMTTNVLGYNTHPEGVIASIRASDADIIALQELNPEIGAALQELAAEYPYQELEPQAGVSGVGVISRYPLEPLEAEIDGNWVGMPQILRVDWEGDEVVVVNLHTIPPGALYPSSLGYSTRERERQIGTLLQFLHSRSEPLIVMGDLNATDQSNVYRMMRRSLQDAWRERGWGLGHTFPGAASPGSSRPTLGGVPVPKWLLRLDYIFCSAHWQVERAWIGQWDGVSDHRPVVARMVLLAEPR